MELFLLISLGLLWLVVLLNLALTMRVVKWIKATLEVAKPQELEYSERQELIIGAPAPEFKARTLTGQAVRLDDFVGRSVAFLFVSPACGHCRMEMPLFLKLAPLAKKYADVELILVSDWGPVITQQWLSDMRTEDGVDVTLPILVAPRGKSDFLDDYNPKKMTPGFCLIDAQGNVQALGQIPSPEWSKLKRIWEGATRLSPLLFKGLQ